MRLLGRLSEGFATPVMPSGAMRYLWIVGLSLFAVVVWRVGWRDIGDALTLIDVRWLGALVVVEATALWLRAWKWRIVLGPRAHAVGLCFLSKAGGNLSPGRVGEFSPLLLKAHRSPKLGAWILADRLLEASTTLVLGICAIGLIRTSEAWSLVGLAAAALTAMAALCLLFVRHDWLERIARWPAIPLPFRCVASSLASVSGEFRALGSRIPVLAVLTLLCKFSDLAVGFFLLGSFGHWVSFALLALVQCGHAVASAIPITPNATGVPYAVGAAILYEYGVPAHVLTAAIGVRILTGGAVFWICFVAGASTLWSATPAPQDSGQSNALAQDKP